MKMTEKDKPVQTIPKGVWESSHPDREKNQHSQADADAQGNGYPAQKQEK